MKIENRDQGDLLGTRDLAPDQEAIGRIERQAPARVRLDYRQRVVPEELIKIVEIAKCPRPHIRSVHGVTPYLIDTRNLKLAVGIASGIGDGQQSGARVHYESVMSGALLIRYAEREIARATDGRARHSRRYFVDCGADPKMVLMYGVELSTSPFGPQQLARCAPGTPGRRNVQRHAVIEQPASRLEQSLPIACQRKGDARPRSRMRGIGDGIAIEPQPEIYPQSLAQVPLVADEPGELILINGKAGGSSELDPFYVSNRWCRLHRPVRKPAAHRRRCAKSRCPPSECVFPENAARRIGRSPATR